MPAVGLPSGWNTLPKSTANLDTLTAAAIVAAGEPDLQTAVNPVAAHHFGGTVGQSNLRPGTPPPPPRAAFGGRS